MADFLDTQRWLPFQRWMALGFLLCLATFFPFLLLRNYLYVFSLHFGLLFLALFFLYKINGRSTLASLGIPGNLLRNGLYFFGGLIGLFPILLLLGGFYYLTGIHDSQNVVLRVDGLPLFVLLAAIFLAPLSEELFFRAFLSSRVGIWISSALFAMSHVAYGSVDEIFTTFVLGAWLAFLYRRSGSILPVIAIHMVFNFISILIMKLVLQ